MLMAFASLVFDNRLGRLAAAAAVLASLVGWFAFEQRSIGRAKERAEITQETKDAAKRGAVAARKSGDGRVRGQRDPTTRDD